LENGFSPGNTYDGILIAVPGDKFRLSGNAISTDIFQVTDFSAEVAGIRLRLAGSFQSFWLLSQPCSPIRKTPQAAKNFEIKLPVIFLQGKF
jgi:hypothetical protein